MSPAPSGWALPDGERRRLGILLGEVAAGVEDLVATGLTTASRGTLDKLDAGFRAASQQRLLRLGSTLRIANEEIRRYLGKDELFSRRRLAFFLNRAWLLSRGMARALEAGDEAAWSDLLRTSTPRPAPELTVMAVGVAKKVVTGVFCAFDFRLRVLAVSPSTEADAPADDLDPIRPGQSLVWSAVFPIKNPAVPPEAYLKLPQPQGFRPLLLLIKPVRITAAAVSGNGSGKPGAARLTFGPDSKIEEAAAGVDLEDFVSWDLGATRERLLARQPGPLDLEVELQEEVVLCDWSLGEREERRLGGRHVHPLACGGLELSAVVADGVEGEALGRTLDALRREPPDPTPPLYGLLHYEQCRLVFQPLSLFDGDWPTHLMLGGGKLSPRELLKALDFTG